jgi:hypothetical protein
MVRDVIQYSSTSLLFALHDMEQLLPPWYFLSQWVQMVADGRVGADADQTRRIQISTTNRSWQLAHQLPNLDAQP